MRWRRIPGGVVFASALATIVLVACGDDDGTGTTTAPTSAPSPATTVVSITAAPSTTSPSTTSPSTSTSPPTTVRPTTSAPPTTVPGQFSVTVGVDSGPDRREQVVVGTTIRLTLVNPDSDDEFHVHGVDLGDNEVVPQGRPKTFTFVAEAPGEIEVESHATDSVLIVITVVA
jgi:hypothetical protein